MFLYNIVFFEIERNQFWNDCVFNFVYVSAYEFRSLALSERRENVSKINSFVVTWLVI
jgi:hypothetical protein